MTVIERRVAAAQATLDRYRDKPLVWGVTDCARIAAFNLRQLGVRAPLARFGAYRSMLGAAKALKRQGYADLAAVVDGVGLRRIAPAAALPADLVGLEAEDLPVTLAVALGNGRVLGFHAEAEGAVVFHPVAHFVAAWSAIDG